MPRAYSRVIGEHERNIIAERLRDGDTAADIQRDFGYCAETVRSVRREAGIAYARASRRPVTQDVADRIVFLLSEGCDVTTTARAVGVSRPTVRKCRDAHREKSARGTSGRT